MNYTTLLKNGIKLCNQSTLRNYLEDAVTYYQRNELISSIDRSECPSFNHQNQLTHAWTPYIVTLNEDLTKFDLYRIYDLDKKEVAQVPVSNVLPASILKKYRFPNLKPSKKSKPTKKVNTVKHTKKSTMKGKKATKKSKTSKKASRTRHKRSKK